MTKNIITIITLLFTISLHSQELSKTWEVSGLEAPESAVFYQGAYYVSNVAGQPAEKNGQGYITKVRLDGTIEKQKWVTGFNAPKGLGIYNDVLYVADIDVVHVVDLTNGAIIKSFEARGATFLNDVEIDKNGVVYITDTFGGNAIYKIENDEISVFLKDDKLDYPNGLKIKGNSIYVASWGVVTDPATFGTEVPGKVLKVNLKDKSIEEITQPTGNLDGLVNYKNGFIISDWIAGRLLSVDKKGQTKELLDLNAGSADITYHRENDLLLVPQMMDGVLTAYELK